MNHTARSAKAPSAPSALFATLRARGSRSAPSPRRPKLILLAACAASLLALAFGVSLASATAPTVTIAPAENVEYTTAKVKGSVDPHGQSTTFRFQYTPQAQFEAEGFENSASAGEETREGGPEPVAAELSGLTPATTYHLRLFAENADGHEEEETATFETLPVAKPTVGAPSATEVLYTTAQATGTVKAGGADPAFNSPCHFDYVTDLHFNTEGGFEGASQAGCDVEPGGTGTTDVKATLSELTPATTYHLRLVASNAGGESFSPEPEPTFETLPVAKPGLTVPVVSAITATSAHLSGEVNPGNPDPAFNSAWHFEYSTDDATWTALGDGPPVEGNSPQPVAQDLSNLDPTTKYFVRLHAENLGGASTSPAPDPEFTTPAAAPRILSSSASAVGTETAVVNATINPGGADTVYRFEYVTLAQFEASGYAGATVAPVPDADIGSGIADVPVARSFTGLTPDTAYRYRVVATNSVAPPIDGPDKTLHTAPLTVEEPDTCPNAPIRAVQHSASLPDCRAWEQVSPVDKNGGEVLGISNLTTAAKDGQRVSFASKGGFADVGGSGAVGTVQYLATRGALGWSTHAITPAPALDAVQTLTGVTLIRDFSDDLSSSLFTAYDLPASAADVSKGINFYRVDNATGEVQAITSPTVPISLGFNRLGGTLRGYSSDLEHVTFDTTANLLPTAEGNQSKVYEWDHGTLRLAGILPDGSIPSEGAVSAAGQNSGESGRVSVSADGSRLFFFSPATGADRQLYLRENAQRTKLISQSEGTVSVPNPEQVQFLDATPDGRHVLFSTTSSLLDSDTNEARDLYLYSDSPQPATEPNLTLITNGGELQNAVGLSDDGTKIYFDGENQGAPGEATNTKDLYYWNEGTLTSIGPFHSTTTNDQATSVPRLELNSEGGAFVDEEGRSEITPDGTRIAFLTTANPTHADTNGHVELYVYDGSSGNLTCASCAASGAASQSDAEVAPLATAAIAPQSNRRPHFLSPDGARAFFTTADPLVARDTNGVADVYEYFIDSGKVALLSSGTGSQGSWFTDSSANGGDVFFVTRNRLVGSDGDTVLDLYDARVGGGLAEPPPAPAPCMNDSCQGSVVTPPGASSPASAGVVGPGNLTPRHRRHRSRRACRGKPKKQRKKCETGKRQAQHSHDRARQEEAGR